MTYSTISEKINGVKNIQKVTQFYRKFDKNP